MSEEIFQLLMQWLDEVLETSPQKWIIVQMHHPVLSARENRAYPRHEDYLQPILEKHRVDKEFILSITKDTFTILVFNPKFVFKAQILHHQLFFIERSMLFDSFVIEKQHEHSHVS